MEGAELEDAELARQEAVQCARDIIAERIRTGTPLHVDTTLEVRDAEDRVVLLLSFASVLLTGMTASEPVLDRGGHPPLSAKSFRRRQAH